MPAHDTLTSLSLMLLGLLAVPGPTNAVIALAGAESGWRRALRLIPVVLGCYLLTAVPLAWLGAGLAHVQPGVASLLRVLAAGWIALLALRLWRSGSLPGRPTINARTVAVTTLLNPKVLIIGLVLLPAPHQPAFPAALAILALAIIAVTAGWAVAGAMLGSLGTTRLVQRAGALSLAAIAVALILGGLAAGH